MKEELKDKKLTDEMMNSVAGGSGKEMDSDERMIASMLGMNASEMNPGIVGDIFANASIKVDFNGDDNANVYKYNGRRISRYEALVRVARNNGKSNFDVRPYLSDSHSDNNRNI